jgi:hypothetical protein
MIPVIIGGDYNYFKTIKKYLSNITGIHEIMELQKAAILGTAHILWKVLKVQQIQYCK